MNINQVQIYSHKAAHLILSFTKSSKWIIKYYSTK